jgi:hypothetical protein
MDQAYKLNLSGSEIRYVNYCRLFLEVISLADISDEQGSYIVAEAWVRLKAHKLSVGNREQCIQQLLSPPSWTAWKRVLQSFTHPNRRHLKTQLGAWTVEAREIRPNFKSYSTQDAVYIKHAAHTSIHLIKNDVINQNITTSTTSAIPNDAIPCFISATGGIHTKFGRQTTLSPYRPPQTQHDHLLIVSDASVLNGNSTWAFRIATTGGHQLTSQSGKVRGHNITSFRVATRDFAPDTRYTVYCDNQSVITGLNTMKSICPQVS